jgi:cystathionine gamma-synthase
MKIETLAIHAGRSPDPASGAVREPIQLSTTFERDADGSYPRGHYYSRAGNPNRSALERAVAALEGGADAVAFGSGSAATLAVFALAAPHGRIVCGSDCYHGTAKQLREIVSKWGTAIAFVDTTDLDALEPRCCGSNRRRTRC